MAEFFADENFRLEVVEALRGLGHDVLTAVEAGPGDLPGEPPPRNLGDGGRAVTGEYNGAMGSVATFSTTDAARLREIGARHGVVRMRLFGSVARREARPDSDVDLLIALEAGRGFRDLMDFCEEAEVALQRRVDVVLEDGLSPHIRERVLREALAL